MIILCIILILIILLVFTNRKSELFTNITDNKEKVDFKTDNSKYYQKFWDVHNKENLDQLNSNLAQRRIFGRRHFTKGVKDDVSNNIQKLKNDNRHDFEKNNHENYNVTPYIHNQGFIQKKCTSNDNIIDSFNEEYPSSKTGYYNNSYYFNPKTSPHHDKKPNFNSIHKIL